MKTLNPLAFALSGFLWVSAVAQPAEPPAEPPATTPSPAEPARPEVEAPPPAEAPPATEEPEAAPAPDAPGHEPGEDSARREEAVQPPPAPESQPKTAARPATQPQSSGASARADTRAADGVAASTNAPDAVINDGLIRLNFRGAPLELVLDYLSEAAGFVIVPEADIRGKVDVWSNQPLTKDEAVEVLNTVLNKNDLAALRKGRTLTIVRRDEAKTRDIQVVSGSDPAKIPKSDEIVTQIIPVRFINAVQLIKDLQPLLPTAATLTANEGGNSVVLTDTQVNIRRMAEIIKALDTAIASVSAIRVFPLELADAKAIATVIKDLFQTQDTSRSGANNQAQQMFRNFRGGPGGMNVPGGEAGGASSGGGRVATPRVVAVADERSNAVIVSAPEEQMEVIGDVILKLDKSIEDVTELRVFHLRNADPQEMADVLAELFPDSTTSQSGGNRTQFRFGGPMGGPFGVGGGRSGFGSTEQSARLQKQSRVLAVPDLRTRSVVVSAARDLMQQISQMIEQLDSDPAKKQKVFVYSVENTDPQAVEEILRNLFESQNSRNRGSSSRSTTQSGTQLNNRAANRQNQGSSSGFGSSSFGSGSSGRSTR